MRDSNSPSNLNETLCVVFSAVVVVAVAQHNYFGQEISKKDQTITYQEKQLEDANRALLLKEGEIKGYKDRQHER